MIAAGTSTQYPTASNIGAIVSPPRAKSANPAIIAKSATPHHTKPRVRDDISAVAIWPSSVDLPRKAVKRKTGAELRHDERYITLRLRRWPRFRLGPGIRPVVTAQQLLDDAVTRRLVSCLITRHQGGKPLSLPLATRHEQPKHSDQQHQTNQRHVAHQRERTITTARARTPPLLESRQRDSVA